MKQKRLLWIGLCIFILLLILYPFITSAYYTLPSADDFVWIRGKGAGFHHMFSDAARIATNFWKTWQGQWPTTFFGFLVNPLNFVDGYRRTILGTEMVLFFVSFFIALGALVHTFVKYQVKKNDTLLKLILLGAISFAFLNMRIYTEAFYWFTGSSYLWALSLHLWTLALTIRYMNMNAKWGNTMGLSLVGFMACMSEYIGAVLQGLVMLCYLWETDWREASNRKRIIPLLFMILGGCLSVFAPGNFKRANMVDLEGQGIDYILVQTGYYYLKSIQSLILNPIFWLTVIIVVFVGMVAGVGENDKNKVSIRRILKYALVSVGAVYFVIFPVELGYNGAAVPDRIYCFINMYNLLTIFSGAYMLGAYIARVFEGKSIIRGLKHGLRCAFLGVILFMIITKAYYKMPSYIISTRMDSIRWVNAAWEDILLEIEESEEDNVVIHRPAFDTYILKAPGIAEKKTDWANQIVADYYGKESIQVIME